MRGLSIGHDAVKSDFKDGVRYLRELKLYEVSLVVMPMNELATVTAVKSGNLDAKISQLAEEIRNAREMWRRWDLAQAKSQLKIHGDALALLATFANGLSAENAELREQLAGLKAWLSRTISATLDQARAE